MCLNKGALVMLVFPVVWSTVTLFNRSLNIDHIIVTGINCRQSFWTRLFWHPRFLPSGRRDWPGLWCEAHYQDRRCKCVRVFEWREREMRRVEFALECLMHFLVTCSGLCVLCRAHHRPTGEIRQVQRRPSVGFIPGLMALLFLTLWEQNCIIISHDVLF